MSEVKMKRKGFDVYNRWGYVFVAPFFIAFLIFQLYPIIYTIRLSFTDLAGWTTEGNFIGLTNFINLLNNLIFIQSVRNTFILWVINFIPQMMLALILAAWFTNLRLGLRGQGFFKTMLYLPNIITVASIAVIFMSLMAFPRGPINIALENMGLITEPINFGRSPAMTRGIVAFIQFWMWYGQTMLVVMAGILSIDTSLFEAAMVDGATDAEIFRKVILPLLKPIVLYILVTSMIGGLQIFDIPHIMTNGLGGPENAVMTITMFIFNQAFSGGRNFGIAAAASVILLLISIVLSLSMFSVFQSKE